jgi:hypothetical protein
VCVLLVVFLVHYVVITLLLYRFAVGTRVGWGLPPSGTRPPCSYNDVRSLGRADRDEPHQLQQIRWDMGRQEFDALRGRYLVGTGVCSPMMRVLHRNAPLGVPTQNAFPRPGQSPSLRCLKRRGGLWGILRLRTIPSAGDGRAWTGVFRCNTRIIGEQTPVPTFVRFFPENTSSCPYGGRRHKRPE